VLVWNDPWDAQLISWQFGYRGVLKVTRGGRHEGYEERGGTIDQTLSLDSPALAGLILDHPSVLS
jgi:hypothetical protein